MIKYALIGMLCFCYYTSICQDDKNLPQLLDELAVMLEHVELGKDRYTQKLTYQLEKPYKVIYKTIITDAKGRSEEQIFDLNLADIDENLVRWESSKKQIEVNLKTKRSTKTIKVFEDGEQPNYENEFSIIAVDIDNARAIEEKLKKIIPIAQETWEEEDIPVALDDMKAMQAWLSEHIKTIQIDDEYFHQNIKFAAEMSDMLHFTLEEVNSKGEKDQTDFKFSLGDLNEASANLEVKGKQLYVECSTHRNSKFIQVLRNGELKNYENNVQFFTNDIDEARRLLLVLQKLIPLCKTQQEERLTSLEQSNTFGVFVKQIQSFKDDKHQYVQQISDHDNCLNTYSLAKENERGSDEYLYKFNFADLNDRKVEINVSGTEIAIPVLTKKLYSENKLIQYYKDGALQNYQDDFELLFPTIESAKIASYALPSIITNCKTTIAPEDINWLIMQVQKIEESASEVTQALEIKTDAPCKYVFTRIETGKKEVEEQVFEFNLHDLDAGSLELEVKGTQVKLIVNTIYKEEIIKLYEKGEASYTNNVEMLLPDVETAKKAIETMKNLIQKCEK